MNPASRAKVGFDEGEQKEFVKALRQPLMVQAPLQVILETFFSRLQAQATMFNELNEKVDRLDAKNIEAEELLDRLRMVESSVKELGTGKLSAFSQQDILRRLDVLEVGFGGVASLSTRSGTGARPDGQEGGSGTGDGEGVKPMVDTLESRLLRNEQKLAGVYNLNGKLIAVEQIAEEMGIEIPDLEYDPSGAPSTPPPPAPAPSNMSQIPPEESGENMWPAVTTPRRSGGRMPLPAPLQQIPKTHFKGMENGSNRLTDIQGSLDKLKVECATLRDTTDSLRAEVERLTQELDASKSSTDTKFSQVNDAAKTLKQKFDDDLTIVWKEFRRVPEVSYADYMLLKGQVEQSLSQAIDHGQVVETLRNEDIPTFKAAVMDLEEQVKKLFEPRDLDNMFHTRMAELEGNIKELQQEVQLGMGGNNDAGVRADDLAALEEALDKKASLVDLKQLAQQYANLARSVSNMAEWLSVRPDTSDGLKNTGSAITKFKCMTCDRDMRTQSFSMGASQSAAKGSFLPKLDAMQGSREHVAPGPGMNPGDLRRMAEDKMGGGGNSPPRGADLDDYAGNGTDVSPPRAAKPSGRVPVAGSGGTKPMPGQRTPVFF